MSPTAKNILLATISLIVSVVLAEILVSVFYPPEEPLVLGEIANWDSQDYKYRPLKSSLGFREAEIEPALFDPDVTRVLFLGDSFTFGQGVFDGKKRFSDLIETKLSKEIKNRKIHIYNAGLPDADPDQWFKSLEKLMPAYDPHYVFAIFFIRDGTEVCTSFRCYEEIIDSIKNIYQSGFFYQNSSIAKHLGNRKIRSSFTDYYIEQIRQPYLGTEAERAPWIKQSVFLAELMNTCENNRIGFHLIIFPLLYSLDSSYPFIEVEKEIARFAEGINIPVFSLTDGFMWQKDHTLWVSPNDQHPNEKGHAIAAETLFPYVLGVIKE